MPERLGRDVDVHPAGERVGDDERRRGEVVRLHLGMDAGLEVPVAREDGAGDEVALGDRLRDRLGQRAGVPDAGRAAVADRVEAERLEVRGQPGLLVVLGHDLRAGREARLHPRLAREAALDGLLGEQAGADHHGRVRGVRAGRDRRDHDGAVVDLDRLAVDRRARPPCAARAVGRQRGRVARVHRLLARLVDAAVALVDAERRQRRRERVARLAQRDPVLRAPRPRERRLDRRRGRARRPGSTSAARRGRARGRSPCSTPRRARPASSLRPVRRR